jgi:parallel beta-helix repeat protein
MILDGLRPGEYRKIPAGVHEINQSVTIPKSVTLEGMPGAVIRTNAPELLQVQSSDIIRGITFEHTAKGRTINIKGNVMQKWRIENCKFINADIAIIAETITSGMPVSGLGYITNNIGIGSKLCTLQGQVGVTIANNDFRNRNGSEFCDFNYNVHNCSMENNIFINAPGYSLSEEVIDMVGGNGALTEKNIIRNNRIVGNFQTGIRPSLSACDNVIEGNYIEWLPGKTAHEASIYLYGKGTDFKVPKRNKIMSNTIINGKSGIELSDAQDTIITGNTIRGASRGIALVKNSLYGDDIAPMNNTVTGNTIYISNPANAIINEGAGNIVAPNYINPVTNFDLTDRLKVNNVLSGSWSSLGSLRNK